MSRKQEKLYFAQKIKSYELLPINKNNIQSSSDVQPIYIRVRSNTRTATSTFSYEPDSVRKVLEQEQRAAFNHFWQFANKQTGMIHASANVNNKNLTTGGSGFGVMVILTGIERGWISREGGRQTYPVLSTLSQPRQTVSKAHGRIG